MTKHYRRFGNVDFSSLIAAKGIGRNDDLVTRREGAGENAIHSLSDIVEFTQIRAMFAPNQWGYYCADNADIDKIGLCADLIITDNSNAVTPNDTGGVFMRQTSAGFLGDDINIGFGLSFAQAALFRGIWKFALVETIDVRMYVGVNQNPSPNGFTDDPMNPGICLQFAPGASPNFNFLIAFGGGGGVRRVDTGIIADTNPHYFELFFTVNGAICRLYDSAFVVQAETIFRAAEIPAFGFSTYSGVNTQAAAVKNFDQYYATMTLGNA